MCRRYWNGPQQTFRHLPIVQVLMIDFRCVSGLDSKAIKCIITLKSPFATPDNCSLIKDWLRQACPGWESVSVCIATKYLGICLRPLSGNVHWEKALKEFHHRVSSICALHLPAALAKEGSHKDHTTQDAQKRLGSETIGR